VYNEYSGFNDFLIGKESCFGELGFFNRMILVQDRIKKDYEKHKRRRTGEDKVEKVAV
jgi:hypothetical protein